MDEKVFEGLKVWQRAHPLMLDVHKMLVPILPPEEKWDLSSQIHLSSKSIGANIAEGFGRHDNLDNVRICYNVRGSVDETVNHFQVAFDLKYCTDDIYRDLRAQAEEVCKLLNGYISWLKTQRIGKKEPGANLYIREIPAEHLVPEDEHQNQ